ncbi:membrane-bound dehydrogenase domain-containing protein [Flammeovirgaceae bacterium 311]|nr:membrane-bound dehydrogenase domain-containing protein [Flammeovirgaceae bacterium 311]
MNPADSAALNSLYDEHVRTTEYQTPEQERLSFILPPGFEVTLFAAEPDITKPINMAFDEKGRLWVSQSSEYPIAAGPGEGNDRITILEDTDGDGRADKINDFSSDLNIPIGIMPVKGGAIGYSIPNIYRFADSDNDGKEDKREVMLGEFGHEDTHGMVNNLIRGFDGWIHASHGYTNTSVVAGTDGDSIKMVSGNTFRFKMDGSRVEKTTDGRINPFGSDFDEMGYLYSADCHTLPIFQLIWDGNYEQWGKKEPNIGFAPTMMDYGLNSTALAGLVYYTDTQFPEKYQNSFYSGDVVTCRISRNTIEYKGSTPRATRQEDFLVSKDPWFRPVDIKIGPDGAMYIADFYNRIIGHYEVPLGHPGRDRISGRIWKITYKGNSRKVTDWSEASLADLLEAMKHKVLATRMMATDELVDRVGAKAIPALESLAQKSNTDPKQLIQVIWALYRLNALPDEVLAAAVQHADVRVKVHAYKVLANYSKLTAAQRSLTLQGLDNQNPHVQRAAAEVLGRHPDQNSYKRLISLEAQVPAYDTHLRYTILLSIRKHLEQDAIMQHAAREKWSEKEAGLLALVASDVQSIEAGNFLLQYVKNTEQPIGQMAPYVASVARAVPASALHPFIDFAITKTGNDLEQQFLVARALNQGMAQRGSKVSPVLQNWTQAVAGKILATVPADSADWNPEMNDRQHYAAEVAGKYKAGHMVPGLKKVLSAQYAAEGTRQAAAIALMDIAPEQHAAILYKTLRNAEEPRRLRQKVARALEQSESAQVRDLLVLALEDAPYELQSTIASILAKSSEGKTMLLKAIRQGHAPARLLKSVQVEEPFLANIDPNQRKEFDALTANLLPLSVERQKLIDKRIAEFNARGKTPEMGKAVFSRNCSMCHQVNKEGGMIGPQLDGIGNWGKIALATKILDPNRNISENFRNYNITLHNGKTISGQYRREEGQMLILANSSGEEFAVSQQDIREKEASKYTLMPDNFNSTIPKDDFDALIVYLLSIKQ